MLTVGLTGGIGAGKSAVSALLAARGAVVVDADLVAREVVAPGTPGLAAVVEAFGPQVLGPDGALDRPRLGALVFGDEAARLRLNAVVHPLVGARTVELAAAAEGVAEVLVHDVPLLVEGAMGPAFPLVVVVEAPVDVRLERLRGRGLPPDQARARMAAQADDAARRAAADVRLDNGGSRRGLEAAVDLLWTDRLLPFARHLAAGSRAPRPTRAEVVPADATWPEQAARVLARVRGALGERALRVEHVGSTAVPGLDAKDVLDVMVVVPDLAAAQEAAAALTPAGLVRLGGRWEDEVPGAHAAPKAFAASADPGRPVNCHVRPATSPAVRDVLLLRDWLRASPAEAAAYAAEKRRLADAPHADVDAYAHAKGGWLHPALERADRWARTTGWTA